MRRYCKPELNMEAFTVEDIITVSSALPGGPTEDASGDTSSPDVSESMTETTQSTTSTTLPVLEEDVFITGGGFVVEALGSLYDNFFSRF